MRLQLLFISATVVCARRSVTAPPKSTTPIQRGVLNPWGCPYGWGICDDVLPNEIEERPMKKVKEVKHVKKEIPSKKGRFGLPLTEDGHPHWIDIDEALDGME